MKRNLCLLLLTLWLTACTAAPSSSAVSHTGRPASAQASPFPPTPTAAPRWLLVWSDEFEGESLNPENWQPEIGAGGWGNHELQFYTARTENLRLADGFLIIEARRETYGGARYTSARIKTQGLQTFQYGRIEARIKLPPGGRGIWPAFWMLGEGIDVAGWPDCGEIDIMENIGDPFVVYGAVHGPGYAGREGVSGAHAAAAALDADFHLYAVEWSPDEIRWLVDDQLFHRVTAEQLPGEWVFDRPFFLLLNVAVGGDWPGAPDGATPFPQRMMVDYVRVYRAAQLPPGP